MKAQNSLVMFGKRLKELRLRSGLSQGALAHLAGIHRNYYGETERGLRNVSLKNIIKLATALEVHPSKLFTKY
jgi:transcriptional regulator with XRE-family HTH domain